MVVPRVEVSTCGGQGRLSVLKLRRLWTGRVKFSVPVQLSPWRAAFSVAEKQSGQHGRRGIVTRGVVGSEDEARGRCAREDGGRDERRWIYGEGGLPSLRLCFLESLEERKHVNQLM